MVMIGKYTSSLPSSEQRQNPQTLIGLGEFMYLTVVDAICSHQIFLAKHFFFFTRCDTA